LAKHGSSFSLWRKEFRKIQNIVFDLAKEDKKSWINGSFFANPSLFYLNNEKRNAFIQALLPYKEYL